MATLAEQFKTALENIEPQRKEPGDDKACAKSAHWEVGRVLTADSLLNKWGITPILIGSYARDVSIRRVKDVDLFGRLTSPPDDLRPGKALEEFERVLCDAYEDRCSPQRRSFKVDFPDFDLSVDVVPAKPLEDIWELPARGDERSRWTPTNPIRLTELKEEMNKEFVLGARGVYVPMVKLVRQIRRTILGQDAHPGGLYYEILTYWAS